MAKIGASKSIAVSFIGKLKTTAQMSAIPLLLWNSDRMLGTIGVTQLGTYLLWGAAVLTLWSMIYYMRRAWPEISERSK